MGDLVCILQHANVKSAICMGYDFNTFSSVGFSDSLYTSSHDWGASVCYEAARSRPDIVNGVIGIVVPVSNSNN